ALAVVNLMGVKPGKFTQNVLAAAKVLGLLGIVAVGVGWYVYARLGHAPVPELSGGGGPPPGMTQVQALALAMVLVFYAYGGWNDTAFVAAEVRDPRRNLVRALILGTLAVTAIYLLVNLAYLLALGYDGASGSKAIAGDVLALPFGQEG